MASTLWPPDSDATTRRGAPGCRYLRRGHLRRPRPWRWSLLVLWHVVRLALHLLLGPGCLRSPRGGGVRGFSQGHGDGHPLVAVPLTKPPLSPPQCRARSSVFAVHQHVDHYKARKINIRVSLSEPLGWWWEVEVVVVRTALVRSAGLTSRKKPYACSLRRQVPGVPSANHIQPQVEEKRLRGKPTSHPPLLRRKGGRGGGRFLSISSALDALDPEFHEPERWDMSSWLTGPSYQCYHPHPEAVQEQQYSFHHHHSRPWVATKGKTHGKNKKYSNGASKCHREAPQLNLTALRHRW